MWWEKPEEKLISILEELDIGLNSFCTLGKAYQTGDFNAATTLDKGDLRNIFLLFSEKTLAESILN
ncbi:MAG: hypothetical protein LBV43_01555 [Prevotella sp.]|jgi:hypothetical protein|nr:hypothetical protein [Prevotella sp.]